jgi:acyl-coenzyme A thioesterase PaaI-like protein
VTLPDPREEEHAVRAQLVEVGRSLADAIGRTAVDDRVLGQAVTQLRALEGELRVRQHDRAPRISYDEAVGRSTYCWQRWNVALPHLVMNFAGAHGHAVLPDGLNELYEGPIGLVHGGVSVVLVDALVTSLAQFHGLRNVTAGLNVRFTSPTPLHTYLTVRAELREVHERKAIVSGSIECEGTVTVEATAVLVRVN